jgi:cytochrome c oxidase subunit 4
VYIQVGTILAVITALEVAIYYLNIVQGLLTGALLALSALKFVMVALWFMHLRFDTKLFTVLFSGALLGVIALFMVVLVSLGASFV